MVFLLTETLFGCIMAPSSHRVVIAVTKGGSMEVLLVLLGAVVIAALFDPGVRQAFREDFSGLFQSRRLYRRGR